MDDMHRTLGNIEGKLEGISTAIERFTVAHDRLDQRIGGLESYRDKAIGAWGVISIVGGVVGAFIHKIFP